MPKKTVELGLTTAPLTINYCSTATALYEERPVDEALLAQLGLRQWRNAFKVPSKIAEKISPTDKNLLVQFAERSAETEKKMAIIPMPVGCEGYELVAIDTIPKNSVLLYSGEWKLAASEDDAVEITEDNGAYSLFFPGSPGAGGLVNPRHYGNMGRFISHAYPYEILNREFGFPSPELQNSVATSNFIVSVLKIGGFPFCLIKATREISAGERLYLNYEREYFRHAQVFLFDKNTHEIIDSTLYFQKNPLIFLDFDGEIYRTSVKLAELRSEINSVIEFKVRKSSRHYNVAVLPEFIIEYLQRNPTLLDSLPANEQFVVPLVKGHPCIKEFPVGSDVMDSLLRTANQITQPVHRLNVPLVMQAFRGSEVGIFCVFQIPKSKATQLMQRFSNAGFNVQDAFLAPNERFRPDFEALGRTVKASDGFLLVDRDQLFKIEQPNVMTALLPNFLLAKSNSTPVAEATEASSNLEGKGLF